MTSPFKKFHIVKNKTAAIPDLENQVQELTTQLSEVRELNHHLCTQAPSVCIPVAPVPLSIQAPLPVPVSVSPTQKSDNINDLTKFDGTHSALRPFITQLGLKIISNAYRFTSSQQQLVYGINLLQGGGLGQVMPLVNGVTIHLTDIEGLITVLDTAFGDPNLIATAKQELKQLIQGFRDADLSAYFDNSQSLAADVPWNEEAQKHALTRGISNNLCSAMIPP